MKSKENKNGKIYLEAILDAKNNCEKIDHSRIFKVNPEKLFMRLITEDNIAVLTYDYWKSLGEARYVEFPQPKRTVILIDEIDLQKESKKYYKDKKDYMKFPGLEFMEVKQYSPYLIHELQSKHRDLDIFILGDSRLYWKCFDIADNLIITYVDTTAYGVPTSELIEFPKIENTVWRETMATILDDLTAVVEYDRINLKGWDD